MIRGAEQTAVNLHILGGFKAILVLGVGAFAFFQINPLAEKKASDVVVTADSYPFVVPQELRTGYIGENAQIMAAKSVWEFTLKNDGAKNLTGIVFELPFSGSYHLQNPEHAGPHADIPTFSRTIRVETLAPNTEARLTLWVGEQLGPEFERMIRVRANEGVLSVSYPVKASGLVAWVEKYKTPLSFALFMLFIITIL